MGVAVSGPAAGGMGRDDYERAYGPHAARALFGPYCTGCGADLPDADPDDDECEVCAKWQRLADAIEQDKARALDDARTLLAGGTIDIDVPDDENGL